MKKCERCGAEMKPRVIGFDVTKKDGPLTGKYIDQAHAWEAKIINDEDKIFYVCSQGCTQAG